LRFIIGGSFWSRELIVVLLLKKIGSGPKKTTAEMQASGFTVIRLKVFDCPPRLAKRSARR
jgi:hypothetical protein